MDRNGALLVTGFPGFLGARLLPRLLETRPGSEAVCLVQPRFLDLAHRQVAEVETLHPAAAGRIRLVPGDITEPGLGLRSEDARELARSIVSCFHLAAVYDLAVSHELGMRVNVLGTRHVLQFLAEAGRFERLDYVSTAYVSGTAVGVFRESDLDVGQRFKNHYEETKYLAELEVARSALPHTIFRPGIVVGDSKTGETAKFDGPYFLLGAYRKLPSPGLFFRIGQGSHPVNLVPVDFVIEALTRLSATRRSLGKTYHLTDPNPMPALEIARLFARLLGRRFAFLPVPLWLAKALLAPAPIQRGLGLPVQSLDYFDHPCRYDAALATSDLAQLGVACPRLPDYAERLVEFYNAPRGEVRHTAMA